MEIKAYFKELHAHFSNAEKYILSDAKSTLYFEYTCVLKKTSLKLTN